jgi:hypothetical protein
MKTLPITEAHVQQTVVKFLELDGWRPIRTDPVSDRFRGKGFGEKGMADHLFVRYLRDVVHPVHFQAQRAEVMWIEFKRKGAKPKLHQQAWIDTERHRGALVLVVDDIDEFTAWYMKSGLNRRMVAKRG